MKTYKRFRYPGEIISHAVWLYHRSCLSFRDVEELLAARGIIVSYETIRRWCMKFGQTYAHLLKKAQGQLGDQWFLDEVFIKINGRHHYLWRTVDQDINTLGILVQAKPNKRAALKFLRKLLKSNPAPNRITTDKLRSYSTAHTSLDHQFRMIRINTKTTSLRFHTSPRGSEKDKWASLNRLARLNVFSLPCVDK